MPKSANLYGPAALAEVAPRGGVPCRETSISILQRGPTHRSFTLGERLVAAIQAVVAFARRAQARHRQRRQARATCRVLRELDDRVLRDLGFDRSEIASVAAEVAGYAEHTRVRTPTTSHGLPT